MSVVHRLPCELLSEIFTHYVADGLAPSHHEHNVCFSRRSSADPRTLANVCRAWRTITYNQSPLWSSLYVSQPRKDDIVICKWWLQNSKHRPLSLHLHQSLLPGDEERDATRAILNLYIDHIASWRTIDIHTVDSNLQSTLDRIKLVPPQLEEAHLEIKDSLFPGSLPIDSIWGFLHMAPKLRCASWFEAFTQVNQLPQSIQWETLTDLTLNGASLDIFEFIELLDRGCALQRLVVNNLTNLSDDKGQLLDLRYSDTPSDSYPLLSPFNGLTIVPQPEVLRRKSRALNTTLAKLEIQDCAVCPKILYNALTLPSLQDLSITFRLATYTPNLSLEIDWDAACVEQDDGTVFFSASLPPPRILNQPSPFGQFLKRSQCHLRSLSIQDASLDDDVIFAYLAPLDKPLNAWKTVESLAFIGSSCGYDSHYGFTSIASQGITADAIALFVRHEGDDDSMAYLPRLKKLALNECFAEPDYVNEMIRSRSVRGLAKDSGEYLTVLEDAQVDVSPSWHGQDLGYLAVNRWDRDWAYA